MRGCNVIVLAVFVAMLLTGLRPTGAGAQQEFGSGGGDPFEALCGTREAMVGISGRYGSLIDAVEALCARIGLDGRYVTPARKTARHGGGGGGEFSLACPSDQVVTSIFGSADSMISGLGIRCSKIVANYTFGGWSLGAAGPPLGPVGGGAGTQFASDCGYNPPAAGLSGHAGGLVGSIRLRCNNYVNIGFVEHQPYSVSINVSPSRTAWEGNSVTVTWTLGGGPPTSFPATPRFKVEVFQPTPPAAGSGTSPSVPSWPSASDITGAAWAAYDYSGYAADTSKSFQLTKPGTWAVRVTAIPFTPEGAGMRMFAGTQFVTIQATALPPRIQQPTRVPVMPGDKTIERKVK
jgi:hypothetical protein